MSRSPYELPAFDVEARAAFLAGAAGAPPNSGSSRLPPTPPRPPAPRSPLLNIWIAWLVIGVSVFGTYFFNSRIHRPDVTSPAAASDPRFEIASRYAVGALHLAAKATAPGAASPVDAARGIYLAQVEKSARTTVDRLRLVTVFGELDGKDAALAQLSELDGKLDNPQWKQDAARLRSIYEHGPENLSADDRRELIAHHGWFARLALAWHAGPQDSAAQQVFAEAARTFAASVCAAVLALGALFGGLVLFVVAMIRCADGKVRLAYVRADRATYPFLEAFAVYVGGYLLLSLAGGRLFAGRLHEGAGAGTFLAPGLQIASALLAMCWPLLRGTPAADWRLGLGWHTGRGLFREMGLGLLGYVAGMPIIVASIAITLLIVTKTGADATHPIINWARGGMRAAWPLYLLASVYAPLVEETLFRGALFHHLRGRHRWWASALLVSVIFAAMHPQGWAAIPALAGIAIVFAAIREWRGTMFASAAAHALHNGILVTLLILSLS